MIQLKYAPFFTLTFLHDYFTSKQCNDLEVAPAVDCLALFNGLSMQYRATGHAFKTWIKVNELGGPFINNPGNIPPNNKVYRKFYGQDVFRFYLKTRKNAFSNYTNITPVAGKKYYFSNRADNERNGVLFATAAVPDHANGREYMPGALVLQPGTDKVFEAITKHTSAALGDLGNANLWVELPAAAYATASDQVDFSGGLYAFTLPAPVNRAEITVYGFNFSTVTPGYTVQVGEKEVQYFNTGEEQSVITVSMRHLKPGRYKITVNSTSREVYYDPALQDESVLGIAELFNHLPATHAYAFLDADEIIQPKQYTIRFAARRVLWKYTRKDGKPKAITDTGPTAHAFTLHTNDFVSQKPIPLAEAALTTLELTFHTPDFKLAPLPNPPIATLGRFHQAGYDYWCSEMYLNY